METGAILYWLSFLMESDAYYSVYVLCAFLGAIALYDNVKEKRTPASRWERGCFCFGGALFSVAVCAANYHIFDRIFINYGGMMKLATVHYILSLVLVLAGGYFIGYHGLLYLGSRFCHRRNTDPADKTANSCDNHSEWVHSKTLTAMTPRRLAALCFIAVTVIDLIYLLGCAYPGILTTDSLQQIWQALSNKYTNHHPLIHTLFIKLCLMIGQGLFHSVTVGVAVYSVLQILFLAYCFSYAVRVLTELNAKWYAVLLCAAWFVLMPFNIIYSVTMWKDVMFGGLMVLFVSALAKWIFSELYVRSPQMTAQRDSVIQFGKFDHLQLLKGAIGICLFRSNGWIAMAIAWILALVIALLSQRKSNDQSAAEKGASKAVNNADLKLLKYGLIVLVITFLLKGPLLSVLHIPQGDSVEPLAIPAQQIARVLVDHRNENEIIAGVSESDLALIRRVADPQLIAGAYDSGLYDNVKDQLRRGNLQAFEGNKPAYAALWLRLGLHHPASYIHAWIDQTKGYWNAGYPYWVWGEGVPSNDYGIASGQGVGPVKVLFYCYTWFLKYVRFFEPLKSIGLHVWILAALAVIAAAKRDRRGLLCILPLAVILTLCLATPVFSEFRYAYGVILVTPLIMTIICSKRTEF